jgi:hypothetical protein
VAYITPKDPTKGADNTFVFCGTKSAKNLSPLKFTLGPLQGGTLNMNFGGQICQINYIQSGRRRLKLRAAPFRKYI